MKGLDLSKFKKMASDGRCTTLKSPEGHKIIIAHHALSPAMKKQLEGISRKYADGGDVDEEDTGRSPASMFKPEEAQAASDKKLSISKDERAGLDAIESKEGAVSSDAFGPDRPAPTLMDRANSVLSLPGENEEIARKQWEQGRMAEQEALSLAPPQPVQGPAPASMAPTPMAAPQQSGGSAPVGLGGSDLSGTMNQYSAGMNQEARAVGQQGRAEVALQNDQIKAQQALMNNFQQQSQNAMNEIHAVMEDYRNQHINPNHYMESMSTGQRVQSAIGMILGGMGAGLTGGENIAAKFLDNQIQRDIQAQEKNMGNKQTLLEFNFKKYGNMKDAVTLTDAMMRGIYATKLEKAASQSKDPIAQGRALQAAAKFKADIIPNIQKFAQSQAVQGLMSSGSGANSEVDFRNKLNTLAAMSPEHYKDLSERYIPGVGIAITKPTDKDREAIASTKQLKESLTELQSRAATIGTTIPGSEADKVNKTKVAAIQLQMKNAYQLGVLSQSDLDMLDKLVANPGSMLTNRAISQLEATKQSMNAIEKGISGKLGITPFQSGNQNEGKTASDTKGNKIVMQNGKWVPYGR